MNWVKLIVMVLGVLIVCSGTWISANYDWNAEISMSVAAMLTVIGLVVGVVFVSFSTIIVGTRSEHNLSSKAELNLQKIDNAIVYYTIGVLIGLGIAVCTRAVAFNSVVEGMIGAVAVLVGFIFYYKQR